MRYTKLVILQLQCIIFSLVLKLVIIPLTTVDDCFYLIKKKYILLGKAFFNVKNLVCFEIHNIFEVCSQNHTIPTFNVLKQFMTTIALKNIIVPKQ